MKIYYQKREESTSRRKANLQLTTKENSAKHSNTTLKHRFFKTLEGIPQFIQMGELRIESLTQWICEDLTLTSYLICCSTKAGV